jgi:diadenosine tetraphosphate (Ap4A) HIT family hydrolase
MGDINNMTVSDCELCNAPGGDVVYQGTQFRVVLVDDAQYPGFCRVIWRDHVVEVTDLNELDRMLMMDVLWQVETVVRDVMQPKKINLASLGNVVPHLHWHIIPRYADDAHFPAPVWAVAQRVTPLAVLEARRALLPALRDALALRLASYL